MRRRGTGELARRAAPVWRRAYASLALALVVWAALATAPAGSARAGESIVVVSGPERGPYRDVTAAIAAGVRLAAEMGAAKGAGPLRVVLLDDGCAAAAAKAAAHAAVALGARLVIGHPCAGAAIAAAPVYAAAGVIFIAPATTHARLTDGAATARVLRLAGRDDRQGWVAGQYLRSAFLGRPVAVLSDKTVAGRSLADAARHALEAGGRTDVIVGHVTAGEKDYTALVRRLAAAGVAAVYFSGGSVEAATIARQMREAGLEARLLVAEAAAETGLWTAAEAGADGLLATMQPDPRLLGPGGEALARLSTAGIARLAVALRAHAALEIWLQASAREAVDLRAIRDGTYSTVIGTVRFAANGDARIPSFAIFEHRRGRLEQLWVPPDGE